MKLFKKKSHKKQKQYKNIYSFLFFCIFPMVLVTFVCIRTLFPEAKHNAESIESVFKDANDPLLNENNLISATVVRIIDGNTIMVNDSVKNIIVKLIGIDIPKEYNLSIADNDFNLMAKKYLSSILELNSTVYLEFDANRYDSDNNSHAYVWFPLALSMSKTTNDFELQINGKMLKYGYGYYSSDGVNIKYQNQLNALCKEAITNKSGLWMFNSFYNTYSY